LQEKYFYVLGSSPSKDAATDAAARVDAALYVAALKGYKWPVTGAAQTTPKAKVLQVEGKAGWFVVLGERLDKDSAVQLKSQATAAAAKSLTVDWAAGTKFQSVADRKAAVDLLADGPIIPAKDLVY
jgi:hypothetical protein